MTAMEIFDKLIRAGQKAVDEFKKPVSHVKGDDFENYVRDWLFVKEEYKQLHRTQAFTANKSDRSEDSKEPDFKFKSIRTGREFCVEAKWRSSFRGDALEWCTYPQLKRYQEFSKKLPVYVILGVGGDAFDPRQVFFIPLKDIKYTKLFRSFLQRYTIDVKSPINPNRLK